MSNGFGVAGICPLINGCGTAGRKVLAASVVLNHVPDVASCPHIMLSGMTLTPTAEEPPPPATGDPLSKTLPRESIEITSPSKSVRVSEEPTRTTLIIGFVVCVINPVCMSIFRALNVDTSSGGLGSARQLRSHFLCTPLSVAVFRLNL